MGDSARTPRWCLSTAPSFSYADPYLSGRAPYTVSYNFGVQQLLTRNLTMNVDHAADQSHFLVGGGRGYYPRPDDAAVSDARIAAQAAAQLHGQEQHRRWWGGLLHRHQGLWRSDQHRRLQTPGSCYPSYNPTFSGSLWINGGYNSGNVPRNAPYNLYSMGNYDFDAGIKRAFPLYKRTTHALPGRRVERHQSRAVRRTGNLARIAAVLWHHRRAEQRLARSSAGR